MITRAFLVGRHAADSEIVGGLSVRERQIRSLRDAGLDVVEVADEQATVGPAIVAKAGLVWHPGVVKRLTRLLPGSGIVTITTALPLEPGEFVVPAATEAERRRATSLLLLSLEKPTDGIASRYIHRPISRQITRLVLPYRVTPNAMTVFAALFGFAGVAVAARGGYVSLVTGAALFWLQNVLDGCDGEIARLKHLRSRSGEWLDQVIDDVLNIAFLAAVGVALVRDGSRLAWWLTWIAVGCQAVHLIGLYAALLFRAGGRGSVAVLRWWVGDASEQRTLGDLGRRDVLSLAYFVFALLNLIVVIFVFQTIQIVVSAVVTTVQWMVWGGPEIQTEGGVKPAGEATA